jgi:predicted alpha/beta-hydrolase family hydrolase
MAWKVAVGPDEVSAAYEPPSSGAESAVFVCAHGAGGNMSDRGVLATANAMRAHGIGVVRFNFIYKEKKSGRPDPMPKCMEVVSAVVERVRAELKPKHIIIGGRSMGGRAASMLAAEGFDADGLLLLAYPLHPAGQPEKLRDGHLPRIRMPVLCFNGTRDTLCMPDLMQRALKTVTAKWNMRWIDGADHSFHVLKSSGRTDAQVMAEIGAVCGEWVRSLTER